MNTTPHSLEMEQAVLGCVLANKDAFAHIGTLSPEHFFEPIHARIFDAANKMFKNGSGVSAVAIMTSFKDDETYTNINGNVYISNLLAGADTIVDLPHHCKVLQDLSNRRKVIDLALNMAETAGKTDYSTPFTTQASTFLDELTTTLTKSSSNRKTTWTLEESGGVVIDKLASLWENNGLDPDAVKTGLNVLDRCTGGFKRGEFTILAGRPSMGKTAVAIQMATNAAYEDHGVAYFSLEMNHDALTRRAASAEIWRPRRKVEYTRISNCTINEDEFRLVNDAIKQIAQLPLIIEDIAGPTAGDVEAKARVIKSNFERQGKTLDVVFVDHLHLMHSKTSNGETERYSHISTGLAEMAKRLGCAVVGLAQLSRGVEQRDDKRPMLSDLRQSGTLEQDADAVIFCYRDEYYAARDYDRLEGTGTSAEFEAETRLTENSNQLELIISKQRNGPTGNFKFFCDIASNVIRDTDAEQRREAA